MKFLLSTSFLLGVILTSVVNSEGAKQFSRVAPSTPIDGHHHPNPIEDKAVLTPEEKQTIGQDLVPGPDYRLPTTWVPFSYTLRIRPIIDGDYEGIGKKNTAPGSVTIFATSTETTNKIVLHSKFLEINESLIEVQVGPNMINVSNVEYDEPRDFLIINLESELQNGTTAFITIHFIANVPPNDSLRGLYSEEYYDPITNRTKVMAVTQLEPLRARQVFPCFDEPTYKAIFHVGIGRTMDYLSGVLSNGKYFSTSEDLEHPGSGWQYDNFQTTVPMPTYLLALAVSEYDSSDAAEGLYHLPVKVYGPTHLIREGKAQLTANASAMLMDNFEKKFGIPHHMPKVDSISVPYKRGAMENYGLITYGEYYLMYHEGTTTSTELRQIYNILAHELAHQWFGNLVTCEWWSDIWLNEGFATYMSYAGQHDLWPEFDSMTFMLSSVNNALQYDASPSSHPIHQEAYDAQQIGVNMDTIGYDKGASLVRMMVSFLKEHVFYDGISQYLNAYYDGVAHQNDLFRTLNATANQWALDLPKSMMDIMNTWTLQKGFPLVRVSPRGLDEFTISQETWENADVRNDTSDPGTTWDIPINYLAESTQDSVHAGSLWLLKEERSTNLSMQNGNGWVLLNSDAGGYYRTLYDPSLASLLTAQLERNHSAIPPEARVRLLDDQLNLGFQKYIPIQSALEFTKYLANETDPTVWHAVFNNLAKVKNFYRNSRAPVSLLAEEDLQALDAALGRRILAVLNELVETTHETPSSKSILRSQLLDWSCTLNTSLSSACDIYAASKLEQWQADPTENPIHTDIQSTLYCKMAESSVPAFDWLLQQYLSTNDATQKIRLSTALGCSTNVERIYELVEMILDPASSPRIEKQHTMTIFQKLITHSLEGLYAVFLNLFTDPDKIPNYYDGDVNSMLSLLSAGGPHFATEYHLNAINTLKAFRPGFYKDLLDPLISTIEKNMEWLGTFQKDMTSWFKENPSPLP